ncbi:hypothetical protein [Corynebacterium sp.]|uniref:hypothetical protein n=1 Tax=Corynebacterium sp. TaxID=1720 RepID=UPI0026DC9A87|nr:hypothetical protein [Corynebacterium sp.]MDO5031326.1 hypothetical protein [Corynebacterium sp.]
MSLSISLDLNDATLADLDAFLTAARSAQAPESAELHLEEDKLVLSIGTPVNNTRTETLHRPHSHEASSPEPRPRPGRERYSADTAIRNIIDMLSERLDGPNPPRGTFGNFGSAQD